MNFAKAWVKDGGIQRLTRQRAEKIADLEKQILEEHRVWQEQMKGAQIMVEKMREQLDREFEWKPAENAGTGMSQEDYEELAKIGTCLTVQEAEKFCIQSVDLHRKIYSYWTRQVVTR